MADFHEYDLVQIVQLIQPDRHDNGSKGIKRPPQVSKNWSALFNSTPDFRAEVLRATYEGDTGWTEWHWLGTRTDGTQFDMRGVTILAVRDGRVTWQPFYMEELEAAGAGTDAFVQNLTHQPTQDG